MTKKVKEQIDELLQEGLIYFLAKYENTGEEKDLEKLNEMEQISDYLYKKLNLNV